MVGFTIPEEDDRHSVHSIASTVATTTSLASRIRDLNLNFGDKLREHAEEGEQQQQDEENPTAAAAAEEASRRQSEEASASVSGAAEDDGVPHSLHLLHRDPPLQPLQVCCRLFDRRSHPPLPLKRLSMAQVEDFRQHGYVVLDNLLTREAAGRIKAEASRLAQQGLLQPVSQPLQGIAYSSHSNTAAAAANGNANGCAPTSDSNSSSQAPVLSSSQGRSASSSGPPPGFANGGLAMNGSKASSSASSSSAAAAATTTGAGPQQQRQQHAQTSLQQQPQQQQQRWGELRLPLQLGRPPADTAVFAPLMAALQELQEDLSEFVRLRSKGSAEYCLCQLPCGSTPVPRHKDAVPDDCRLEGSSSTPSAASSSTSSVLHGRGQQQQQPAAVAGSSSPAQQQQQRSPPPQQQQQQAEQQADNAGGQPAAGPAAGPAAAGVLHAGPPARRVSMFVFLNPDYDKEAGGVVRLWPPMRPSGPPSTAAASAARRSPTSSDAGTTFSEMSDCGSLRVAFLGSTTSSVIAEASAPDHDTYSLDGISVAESEVERQGFEWVECEGGEMALDIAPLAGRVLLVLSGAVEHALLPGSGSGPGCDTVFVRAWCC